MTFALCHKLSNLKKKRRNILTPTTPHISQQISLTSDNPNEKSNFATSADQRNASSGHFPNHR